MARLNLRLTCSLASILIILVLWLWPGTHTQSVRQFWTLSGEYQRRVGYSEKPEPNISGLISDARLAELLANRYQIPLETRAMEISGFAATRRDPALWAHVIRQTSTSTVPDKPEAAETTMAHPTASQGRLEIRHVEPVNTDEIRKQALAQIELNAAEQGAALDPKNAFFSLAKCTALCKLERWDEITPVLIQAQSQTKYDDYVFDEIKRRVETIHTRLDVLLPADLGRESASIFFPHLANFKSLIRILPQLPTEVARFQAGLGLAHAGKLMEGYQDNMITRLVGTALITGSVASLVGEKPRKEDFPKQIASVIQKANSLQVSGWRSFEPYQRPNYQPPQVPKEFESAIPDEPMLGVHSLFVLALIGILGASLWLGSQIDPSSRNLVNVCGILIGIQFLASFSVERKASMALILAASSLFFLAFLLFRLPGRTKSAWFALTLGALCAVIPILFGVTSGLPSVFVLFWVPPYLIAKWIKPSIPKWSIQVLCVAFLAVTFWFIYQGLSRRPMNFWENLPQTSSTLAALLSAWVPLFLAYLMSLAKQSLTDAMKQLQASIPAFALIAAIGYGLGVREAIRQDRLWAQVIGIDSSPRVERLLRDALARPANQD